MMKEEFTQAPIEPLLGYFNKLILLDNEEKQLVAKNFHPRLYRKRQYVLQEGDICNQFNFIVRGCLRMYKIDGKGNVHILQFATENWWMMDIGSFHSKKPALLNIDALEDTMVLHVDYDGLIEIFTRTPRFNRIFRVLVENSYVSLQNRLLENISSTAEERYLSFLDTYPHLSNRLPQTQIAAYLGITPEFLSRIRNSLVRKP